MLINRLRTSRWFSIFIIGLLLGAFYFMLQLSLKEIRSVSTSNVGMVEASHKETGESQRNDNAEAGKQNGDNEPGFLGAKGEADPQASTGKGTSSKKDDPLNQPTIRIYLTKEKRIESVPLETYVRGVVAGEMPIGFQTEALKAQAIAARTYIVRRMNLNDISDMPVSHADVTDTIQHQVYVPLDELSHKWPKDEQEAVMKKLNAVIEQTKGLIITYDGAPIQATFFSTSNGYTENSEDYWQEEIPYLRSVASPWDEGISPKYKETIQLDLDDLFDKLAIKKKDRKSSSIRILKKTTGNRIGMISIGGKEFTGREVRERLGLASSQFTWAIKKDSISITTYGYGHGVGMSQWGANGMGLAGKTAKDIITHYYTGTKIEKDSKLLKWQS